MPHEIQPAALGEERVRELINRWNGQGFLRIKNLGDKVFVDDISPRYSYQMRLRSQYEERSVSEAVVPYTGGHVDDFGRRLDPWDLPVRRPEEFEDRSETMPLPHTERVTMCARCAGYGRIDCATCAGSGLVKCPSCQGRGFRERQEMRTERDAQGNMVSRSVMVQERCSCRNGEVTCSACNGNGRQTCPLCAGACKTKTFDQVTIEFRAVLATDLLDPTDVPDHLVSAAKGEVIAERRAARLEQAPPVEPEVDRRVQSLLQKSHAVAERHARLLFQEVQIGRVNIQEVRYRYAGKALRLWIYGQDGQLYAPGVPWHWQKLLGILAGAVGVVVLIGVIIAVAASR